MESFGYFSILVTFSVIAFYGTISQYREQDTVNIRIFYKKIPHKLEKVKMKPDSKWIVVTSVQHPTEDVKNLASQPDWNLVVVADTKTPADWNYTGVHFLSLEQQQDLFGHFSELLPYKSYTRKNLGYLYALMNGAEWIYDTDDDNKPYGLGLSQFDYDISISGIRYISKSENISEKVFNPYRFYGFDNMWPRGFPLEYLEEHTNGKDRMISCREMHRPVVQQGIVKADPDVDAIYRLLHAKKDHGLNVTFNSIAPPIVLDSGTYSPWNSQNTLFHYKAFFIMYLPTTVAFRVTDIWRSYFGQKLLHLIGENVAFYPTNVLQIRNAHNYLSDFHQEIDVYEQSGKIVEFLDGWGCSTNTTVECVLELADGFVENEFFGKADRDLLEAWLEQLTDLGYEFPLLVSGTENLEVGAKYSNCREANMDFGRNDYRPEEDKLSEWAAATVNGFGEILNWCESAEDNNETFLPIAGEFLHHFQSLEGLQKKKNTVVVFISSSPWRTGIIGLLQRMYSAFFKTSIFCGTWTDPAHSEPLPPIEPINFVNVTPEEMRNGYGYGYCVSKIRDLRLQNATGYYFVADDTVFNIWKDLPLEKVVNPEEIIDEKYWWRPEEIQRSYDLFENKYKNHEKFGKSWREYKEALQRMYPNKNVTDHYLSEIKKTLADFIYIPSTTLIYFGNLMEVMTEAEVFVEVAFGKVMDGLDYDRGGEFKYLWQNRPYQWALYNSNNIGIHPIKLGNIHGDLNYRRDFCNTVIKAFSEKIYGIMQ